MQCSYAKRLILNPEKKFHLTQKLRKACVYAMQLDELCKHERCDARTRLEAQAYVSWIQGSLQFELQLWQQAAENLKKAQVIYEKLATALPEDEQPPYRQRVEEIAPSLRYCAYNIGDDKAIDLLELRSQGVLENFDALVSQTKEKTAAVLHEVQWFSLKNSCKNRKVSIEGLDESLKHAEDNQAKIKILENLFIDLRDVISLTRDSARTEKQDQLLLSYLLSVRIERTSQPYRALRSYYIGKTHVSQKRWKEAAVLFDSAAKTVKSIGEGKFIIELEELISLVKENAEMKTISSQANFILDQQEDQAIPIPQKTYKSKKPLIERLDEFREDPQLLSKNPNIVPLPPPMEPVPAKPLFYDLALNFVEFPDLTEKLDGGQPKQKQGAGISGFVKGLWGWGKK
ncbi:hypothetical protein NQ317_006451 [Molorchus minor]|uniref:Signal recognition particle subunit SRP68 n=1 Tax=Molorchus minor TaxID=1323400 RepID=A0ABQ9IUI4_9CUCU|nr:hypothetical protein NQ317_006451 [Molorchus minor]